MYVNQEAQAGTFITAIGESKKALLQSSELTLRGILTSRRGLPPLTVAANDSEGFAGSTPAGGSHPWASLHGNTQIQTSFIKHGMTTFGFGNMINGGRGSDVVKDEIVSITNCGAHILRHGIVALLLELYNLPVTPYVPIPYVALHGVPIAKYFEAAIKCDHTVDVEMIQASSYPGPDSAGFKERYPASYTENDKWIHDTDWRDNQMILTVIMRHKGTERKFRIWLSRHPEIMHSDGRPENVDAGLSLWLCSNFVSHDTPVIVELDGIVDAEPQLQVLAAKRRLTVRRARLQEVSISLLQQPPAVQAMLAKVAIQLGVDRAAGRSLTGLSREEGIAAGLKGAKFGTHQELNLNRVPGWAFPIGDDPLGSSGAIDPIMVSPAVFKARLHSGEGVTYWGEQETTPQELVAALTVPGAAAENGKRLIKRRFFWKVVLWWWYKICYWDLEGNYKWAWFPHPVQVILWIDVLVWV